MRAGLCIALVILLFPGPVPCETLHLELTAGPDAQRIVPDLGGVRAGLQRFFDGQYSTLVSVDFDAGSAATAVDPSARVTLGVADGRLTVSSDLTRAGAARSLVSTVPTGSPASLLATIAGDLAFLYSSSRGLAALPLSPPPLLTAVLSIDTLGALTAWNHEDLEPVGLSASGDEITICFPHRYLTLGPLFRISASTVRDIQAQSAGREPMLLSGVVTAPGDDVVLLSEREGRLAVVNPRLGTRQLAEAPGLTALPARLVGPGYVAAQMPRGTVAAQMPRGTVAALSSSRGGPEVNLYPLDGGPPRSVSIAASYVPAFDVDREGNFWAWDAEERRVRILTPSGTEVFSIRPLFSASAMPLPQRLEVLDDGSFLLCGSAEVWKFQASGVPVWRLARIPGRPGEALPATFELGVNRATGSFVVLDAQSRRLLAFSDSPEGEAARLAALFTRLDARKQADVRELAGLARSSGLPLMALQFGDLLARGGGTGPEREAARVAILRQKATGYSALAEGLARDLLFERADAAYRRTADALRGLTAESPDDSAAASLLQTVIARGREVRAALAGPASARIVSARLVAERRQSCSSKLTLLLRLRNTGTLALTGVRVHADIPGVVTAPSLAALDALSPAAERELSIPFGTVDDDELPSAAEVPGFALFTADRAQEGISFSMSFAAQVTLNGEARSLADILACRAVTRDTLAASLPVSLLSGTAPGAPQPLAELAGILGALGAARGELPTEAGVESTAAPDGADQPSMPMPAREGMRAALRSLSRDEAGWTVVTASIAMSQGMPAAIVSIGNRAVALVDTGVPLLDALAGVPDLGRFRRELDAVSRGGTLWIPLSGRVPPPGARPWSWSLEDALELLAGGGAAGLKRADLVQSGDRENAPIPFPLFLPVAAELPSLDALRAAARAAANAAARGIGSP